MVELYEKPAPFHRRRPYACCCLVCASFIVIIGIVILILAFTVFKAKKAQIVVDSVTVESIQTTLPQPSLVPAVPSVNLTLAAVISVYNPNRVSMKYSDSTSTAYYYDKEVATVPVPAGHVGSKSTEKISTTLVVYADKMANSTHLASDLVSGSLPMTAVTHISGRVKIAFVKRHVDITSSCSFTVIISNSSLANMDCENKVHL
ncbi:hypothetical protein KP509_28G009400 [Ceratopteris richardii]|uniref:Late embryogenesis abundant protein LEA-2 subgroup domain-containing protein n=1 Tax=Ceratopteris richardii TaxID=49495 RepID=A0A8T2RB08_CERRI|nr:hypothetical protein KP509_28G009400 [Ceratopteris richardii]